MKKNMKKVLSLLLMTVLIFVSGCSYIDQIADELLPENNPQKVEEDENLKNEAVQEGEIEEDGYYTGKEEVALYLHTYGKLPQNFITKKEASALGWQSNKANLWDVTDRKSIGGDKFGNREGRLPKAGNRQYYECDIDYDGEYRGAKRIVYSDDGLIYYTDDHYDSFTLLYGDE